MALNARIVAVICASLMLVACIFYIVSNAVPQWGSAEVGPIKTTFGIWRTCLSGGGITECEKLPSTCSKDNGESVSLCQKILVARAFVTIACIISALSTLCLFVYVVVHTDSTRILIIISKILTLISFIAGVVGVAVGIAFVKTDLPGFELAASAIIGIIAVILNAIAAILALIIK